MGERDCEANEMTHMIETRVMKTGGGGGRKMRDK